MSSLTRVLIAASVGIATCYGAQPNAVNAAEVAATASVKPNVAPSMRSWAGSSGFMTVNAASRIVVAKNDFTALAEDAHALALQMGALTSRPWIVVQDTPRDGDILLRLNPGQNASPEGYSLTIKSYAIIDGHSAAGVFYGGQTLMQLLKRGPSDYRLPHGTGLDFPEFPVRAVMLDAGRHYFEIPQIEALMREMAWKKLNTLHLHLTDWPAFRLRSDKYPGLAPEKSYGREDIRQLEATAARYHITIIPEIDLPAHSQALIDYRPSLGFTCPSMRSSPWLAKKNIDQTGKAWTVDITKEANNVWIHDLLGEFIPWFSGPYFHIGGDEYQYDVDKVKCPELMAAVKAKGLQYPGDVMVDWINQTNEIVKSHGKRTIIWSWWRFHDDKTSIQPAKDIIIDVWNEEMQPKIIADGYETILSPENTLYVTPGIEGNHPDTYGMVDTRKVYEQFPFEKGPGVKGYALSVWADEAEGHTDQYFLGRAYEPMNVLAARLWSGPQSDNVWEYFGRVNAVSLPPDARPQTKTH